MPNFVLPTKSFFGQIAECVPNPVLSSRRRRSKHLCKFASFDTIDDSDYSTPTPDISNLKRGSSCSNRNFRGSGPNGIFKRKSSVCVIRENKSYKAPSLKEVRSRSMSLPQTVSIDPNLNHVSLEGFKGLMNHQFFFYIDPLASPEYPINQEEGFDETLSSNSIMKGLVRSRDGSHLSPNTQPYISLPSPNIQSAKPTVPGGLASHNTDDDEDQGSHLHQSGPDCTHLVRRGALVPPKMDSDDDPGGSSMSNDDEGCGSSHLEQSPLNILDHQNKDFHPLRVHQPPLAPVNPV